MMNKGSDAIPTFYLMLLSVSFDNHIGHDYLNDYEERYEFYHRKEDKISFDLEYFNKITKVVYLIRLSILLLLALVLVKSLFMCHVASVCYLQGKNVLYITMEMAEEKIAERIDANLLNIIYIKRLQLIPKPMFEKRLLMLQENSRSINYQRISYSICS